MPGVPIACTGVAGGADSEFNVTGHNPVMLEGMRQANPGDLPDLNRRTPVIQRRLCHLLMRIPGLSSKDPFLIWHSAEAGVANSHAFLGAP